MAIARFVAREACKDEMTDGRKVAEWREKAERQRMRKWTKWRTEELRRNRRCLRERTESQWTDERDRKKGERIECRKEIIEKGCVMDERALKE